MGKQLTQSKINQIIRLHNQGFNKSQIATKLKVSRTSVQKYIRSEDDQPDIPEFLKEGPGNEPSTPEQPSDFAEPTTDLVEQRNQEMRSLRHKTVAAITFVGGLVWWLV